MDGSDRGAALEAFGWFARVTFEFAGVDVELGVPIGAVAVPAQAPRGGRPGPASLGGGKGLSR